jgi:tetratricopeptide (TPR) repeat protein
MDLIPLPILFKVDHNSPYYHEEDKTSVFYIESWALTHLLETADFQNKTHKISDYDRRVSGGEDPVTAAQHAFGDLDALQKQLAAYVAQIGFQGIRLRMNFNIDDSTFKASPISADQADAVRADLLTHVGRAADAKALVQPILERDPKNALAVRDMGFITQAAEHDKKAARKWFEQAAELDPQDYTANYYAAAYEYGDPAAAATRETRLRQCIKLQPDLAPAYNDLADLFVTQNRNLDEAHMVSIKAVQLDPSVLTFRYTAAEVLEAQHNPDSALMVLTEAKAHVARTPAQLAEIDKRIARLQQAPGAAPAPQTATSITTSH